ncbi:hypothetical protein J7L06_01940 [Candidatus Bathyarchaeota archaeon]|nr:hypothetical protein [Candidatus Bathyarchaeota archaeon]
MIPPEVVKVIDEAARQLVLVDKLLDKAGKTIAEIVEAEATHVTSGAAAGITRRDVEKMKNLPSTSDMKSEIIVQRLQHNVWMRHLA